MADVEDAIMDYVTGLGEGSATLVTPDSKLLESGLLDSINLVQLIQFLEERFGLTIADSELVPETFESVRAIAGFVRGRMA
jgi:acyl carrier protein